MKKPLPVSATSPLALYVMTETTEGLTRRMSSGSESCARALAAKKKRARSASHGGSLRFNIFRAFFSKRVGRAWSLLGLVRRDSTGETQRRLSRRAASGGRRRRANNYDLIFCEVNHFVTKLCRGKKSPAFLCDLREYF